MSLILFLIQAFAGHYNGFKVSVYTRAYEVEQMKDLEWLDRTWKLITDQVKIDKIYLETHRDLLIVPDSTIEQAKKFFESKGVETGGGITYTINESNSFETFCYSDPEHRYLVQNLAELTAHHFNDFILDDFFFTSCKSDIEIEAKGNRSWTDYRLDLMAEAGKNLVHDAAHKINNNVKVIIKYPNWYDHFQGLGFDLSRGPKIFDGIWTGTETRDPGGSQHLQNYLSYNVIRYFTNLNNGSNGGGWVDTWGNEQGADRYAEQLWLTMFAKAPEIGLFAYNLLMGVKLDSSIHRTKWQGQGSSFDYDRMIEPYSLPNGEIVSATTYARVAGVTFEKINAFIEKLGKPIGIFSYKPYNSYGEDFLQNYLGMIGLPMDMFPYFPEDQKVVLLTEQAKLDENLIPKIKKQLQSGGDVVITSGLLSAIPEKLGELIELKAEKVVLVNNFGPNQTIGKDILIKQIQFQTNDAWEMASAGRPLAKGTTGFPMLVRCPYSYGNLYVMTIPEDFGDLYELPEGILNTYREALSSELGVRLLGQSKVSLFLYDNEFLIVENFNDEKVTVQLSFDEEKNVLSLKDFLSNEVLEDPVQTGDKRNIFTINLNPHQYRVLENITSS